MLINTFKLLSAVIVISLVSSCSLAPDYTRPEMQLQSQFQDTTVTEDVIANLPWWDIFHDKVLQDLVKTALAANKDLEIAAARVEAAKALLGFTRADQFPQLGLSGSAQRIDASDEILSFATTPRNNFGIFSDLSFELDIWGKLRNATAAQRAELLASEYGRRAVVVSLVSQVAVSYLNILGLDNRLKISIETYKNRGGATKLINARFEKGMIPELDVNQAQIEEQEAAVAVAIIKRQLRQAENALSVLLGSPPHLIPRGDPLIKQNFDKAIPSGFPAALLERRPDVLAAEETAKAAVARIGVARADQLPSLSILGFVGFESSDISDLGQRSAFSWSIGGDILGPLIDWGKSGSQVDLAEANAYASYRQYEQTVLQSVQEVEDSLIAISTYKEEYEQRKLQVAAASNASKLARARYDDGVSSYIDVLDIERSLFQAELGASGALENYYSSIVKLYKVLGGGWQPEA